MRKSRILLRITGGIFLLFTLLWLLANAIITFNKESINQKVVVLINKQIIGNVSIGDLSTDVFRTFPNISVRLSDVSITDPLWNVHHHDFLKADRIYVRLQFFSLLRGKPKIGKVIVEDSSIYLYTDECGYCNLNRKNDVSFNQGSADIPEFAFRNTRIIIHNEMLNSYHDVEAQFINCDIIKKDSAALDLRIGIKALVHSIGFNMEKGSYLKEKTLEGKFILAYQPGNKMVLKNVNLEIEKHPYTLNGNIYFNSEPMEYDLVIQSKKVIYHEGVDLLSQALQQKLDSFNILEPYFHSSLILSS